ncbi:L-aspartate dehydrogenase [Bordetella pertussis]|nr:L-aspartate dehydrogenase [Bordetella pertussis]
MLEAAAAAGARIRIPSGAMVGIDGLAAARHVGNVNLTGTIALAGIGFDRTRVEMLIDPDATANVHELLARGEFGDFHARVSGLRISESSPSSRIVAGSLAQAALGSGFLALS